MDQTILDRVRNIISNLMQVPFDEVTIASSPGTIKTWDSLQHLNLILALEETLKYVREKLSPCRPSSGLQATYHNLADMATLVEVSREFVYRVAAKINAGEEQIKEITMAKNFSTCVSGSVTDEAIQIHGNHGCLDKCLVERLFRDNRVLSIGGGTREIMKEIISRLILPS